MGLGHNSLGHLFCCHAGEVMSGVDGVEFFKDIHILIAGPHQEFFNIRDIADSEEVPINLDGFDDGFFCFDIGGNLASWIANTTFHGVFWGCTEGPVPGRKLAVTDFLDTGQIIF